jgi:hypothetical protein
VKIDGVGVVQVEVLNGAPNEGLEGVKRLSGVLSVHDISGRAGGEELG